MVTHTHTHRHQENTTHQDERELRGSNCHTRTGNTRKTHHTHWLLRRRCKQQSQEMNMKQRSTGKGQPPPPHDTPR